MSDIKCLKPDREFLQEILAEGGENLKKCFQCATCSVVCELSDGDQPFPRKEMIWAQWGLKDRLVADPDIWLCHRCQHCSHKCPRDARPGNVLAALRRQTVLHYSFPLPLGKWVNRLSSLPLMLLIPAVLLALALLVRDPLGKVLSLGEPHGFYAALFPHWLLIGFFTLFTGLAFLASVVGLVRFWRAMKSADEKAGRSFPAVGIGTSIIQVLKSIISHRKFVHCQEEEMGASVGTEAIISPRTTHLLVFYGFLSLFAVTVWAVLDLYLMPLLGIRSFYPFPLIHPVKIVANLGCLVLLVGGALALRDRWNNRKIVGFNTAFDWIFLGELLAVGLTGLVTEILRFAAEPGEGTGLQYTAYAVYFVHLVLVFALLVYLPYSKFSHLLYRTTALVYAEYFGRNKKGP